MGLDGRRPPVAGADPERAVYYPEDDRFLLEKSETVDHYEVAVQA